MPSDPHCIGQRNSWHKIIKIISCTCYMKLKKKKYLEHVWERGANHVLKKFNFFFAKI
jgi:hypothetical protein